MSGDLPPYPPIDPTNYDLVVVGTGLPESVISAAASSAGKSVLHLDPNPFYGSHYASLPLSDLSSFLQSHSICPPPSPPSDKPQDFLAVDLTTRPLYSGVEINDFAPQILEEHSRKFNIDVCGPRVLFCADKSIDLMLKSGSNHYVEFKSIHASFVGDKSGELQSVPDSRAAIFKDKSMTLIEKNQLMKFFKLVQEHLGSASESESMSQISEEDLETPFVEFLEKMRLPPKIKSIVLYAIALLDYDQDNSETCRNLLKTRDGIDRLAVYSSSVGRFSNALGALIYPIYGQGELPQAFCRRAAVKGCLYVLRMPVTALLLDKDTNEYKGIRLASGQDLFSKKLILDPSIALALPSMSSLSNQLRDTIHVLAPKGDSIGKVARGICIIRGSVKADISNLLVVYPPSTLFPEQVTAIRVLQIGCSLAVCPEGMHVLYLSTLCEDTDKGKEMVKAAMNVLVTLPVLPGILESDSEALNDISVRKPTALWRALYAQELIKGEIGVISSLSMPDGNLNFSETVESAVKMYEQLFGSEELFQEIVSEETVDAEAEAEAD
ncbi:PREDICTED: rab escort protein 1 [Tarenaya hassleriana]|uniref:rab escort protein 1 n=1 Tax=Tarenaya hassleriana TaxID=28532 RepID=UPI00053C2D5A|nr:PREDICTED: rab escort protein 1 [Tarenaya hassleriana]